MLNKFLTLISHINLLFTSFTISKFLSNPLPVIVALKSNKSLIYPISEKVKLVPNKSFKYSSSSIIIGSKFFRNPKSIDFKGGVKSSGKPGISLIS